MNCARRALVANPGCFPTGALLALLPLIKRDLIEPSSIIIDAKSGTTGARRAASVEQLFAEVNENFRAYKVGNHRHVARDGAGNRRRARTRYRAAVRAASAADHARNPDFDFHAAAGRHHRGATCAPRSRRASPSRASYGCSSRENCRSCATCARRTSAKSRSSSIAAVETLLVITAIDNLGKGAAGPGDSEHEPDARLRRSRRPAQRGASALEDFLLLDE